MKKKKDKPTEKNKNPFQEVIESQDSNSNCSHPKEVTAKKVKEATDMLNVDNNTADRG